MSLSPKETIRLLEKKEIPTDFDWNRGQYKGLEYNGFIQTEPSAEKVRKTILVSEDLRDGLHGVPEIPAVADRLNYVKLMSQMGIKDMIMGIYSGTDNWVSKSTKQLLKMVNDECPDVNPIVLTPAIEDAYRWTVECHEINPKLSSLAFMGSAPTRLLVEGWTIDYVETKLKWLVGSLKSSGIKIIGATEHTTQTPPDYLRRLIEVQVANGADGFCIADTIGTSFPTGAARITKEVKRILHEMDRDDVLIDWHGHQDLGLGSANALAAIAAGADRVHVVAGGIGERAGNVPLESILVSFYKINEAENQNLPWKVGMLDEVLRNYHELVKVKYPDFGPMGKNAKETHIGIHAAAILKARMLAKMVSEEGNNQLASVLSTMERTVYTAVDPEVVGREIGVRVGPMSGESNVRYYADKVLGIGPDNLTQERIQRALDFAKNVGRVLTKEELTKILANGHH